MAIILCAAGALLSIIMEADAIAALFCLCIIGLALTQGE